MKRISAILLILFSTTLINAQTTVFTYQGKLNDGVLAAQGSYEMQFKIYDTQTVGTGFQIGLITQTVMVNVVNGIFTTQMDFGQFPFSAGSNRFLQISVRRNSGESFVTLEPRQPLTSTPYSIRSKNADTAITSTNSTQLGGVDANQYVITNDTRMTDDRNPLAGSANYVQNTTTQQTSSNFNISGEGRANILTAETQFNIGTNRILSNTGTANLFIGNGAGASNTTGTGSSFVGANAGMSNTTICCNSYFGAAAGKNTSGGGGNAFFGYAAGFTNISGGGNAFFGDASGYLNTSGDNNSFFGRGSGFANTTGTNNVFVGREAGVQNTVGSFNTIVGNQAGYSNTTGNSNTFSGESAGFINLTGGANSFYGREAGRNNTTGNFNSFIGRAAGVGNTSGSNNSVIGFGANLGAGDLNFATAIGSNAVVSTSNTIALGRADGSDKVRIFGLGTTGSTPLCRNANNEISTCSAPLVVNEMEKNEVIKSLSEQQSQIAEQNKQIEEQQKQLDEQQRQIEILKQLICSQNKDAAVCKEENK